MSSRYILALVFENGKGNSFRTVFKNNGAITNVKYYYKKSVFWFGVNK